MEHTGYIVKDMSLSIISSVSKDIEVVEETLPFVERQFGLFWKDPLEIFKGLVCWKFYDSADFLGRIQKLHGLLK